MADWVNLYGELMVEQLKLILQLLKKSVNVTSNLADSLKENVENTVSTEEQSEALNAEQGVQAKQTMKLKIQQLIII